MRMHFNWIAFALLMLSSKLAGKVVAAAAMSTSASVSKQKGPTGALIFLHGLGDSPAGWSSLEQTLPALQPSLSQLKYIFPPAPTIPLTINNGATMPGWFDLYDWPIGIGAKDDREGKLQAVAQIEQQVEQLEKEHGIPKHRIVVGGFSQGGAIALLAAYYQENKDSRYAACASLSGWLTLTDDLKVSENSKKIPLFWAHGQYDDKVLFEQQAFGIQKLQEQGVDDISPSSYPMGHESRPDEMKAFAAFLDKTLFSDETNAEL